MTLNEVTIILRRVRFAPSCVDMNWKWDAQQLPDGGGLLIRTSFQRPDRDTGLLQWGYGRWWHVPQDVTESGIVKTAFAAAKMILEHELMESFRYDGVRLFDPHHDLADLTEAAVHRLRRARRTEQSSDPRVTP